MFVSPYLHLNDRTACELTIDTIALEGAFLDNMAVKFQRIAPQFSGFLQKQSAGLAAAFTRSEPPSAGFFTNQGRALRSIKTLSYSEVGERRIAKPEGFNGLFLPYAHTLRDTLSTLNTLRDAALAYYKQLLSETVTNKDAKYSITPHHDRFNTFKQQRLQLIGNLHVYFQKDTGESKTLLKAVIERLSDIPPLFTATNAIERTHKALDLKKIQKDTLMCSHLIDDLIRSVETGETTTLTPEVVSMVAVGADELGRLIELTAVVYYDTGVFLHTMDRLAVSLR